MSSHQKKTTLNVDPKYYSKFVNKRFHHSFCQGPFWFLLSKQCAFAHPMTAWWNLWIWVGPNRKKYLSVRQSKTQPKRKRSEFQQIDLANATNGSTVRQKPESANCLWWVFIIDLLFHRRYEEPIFSRVRVAPRGFARLRARPYGFVREVSESWIFPGEGRQVRTRADRTQYRRGDFGLAIPDNWPLFQAKSGL